MKYSLKNPPPVAYRPDPLTALPWLLFFLFLIVAGIILTRVIGKYTDVLSFWMLATGGAIAVWSCCFIGYILFWLIQHIIANGYDTEREVWMWQKTCQSRRALQVLQAKFITAYPDNSATQPPLEAMMANDRIIAAQTDRGGNKGINHSQLAAKRTDTVKDIVTRTVADLLLEIKTPLLQLPPTQPINVLLESTSSLDSDEVKSVFVAQWQSAGLTNPFAFIAGSGVQVVEHWLDHCIREKALLLVLALQIDPEQTDNTGEAAVALLLGNRLTQTTITPTVLLHRPDRSSADTLDTGMKQAAYHVPLHGDDVQYLWYSGLTPAQSSAVMTHSNAFPAGAVEQENLIQPDRSIGQAGVATCWLMFATAANAADITGHPHMVITGDSKTDEIWSAIIAPVDFHQEKDA
ncbi:hypothetical protein [Enterobacter ludwigii]|uniref:hypothetical protein n=1 Tax=Enterobacter ludwigii TaxID=299767 RepID=UPI001E47DF3E|nr:hypothetical protein [Enterobacter ludwigii]MCE1608867.1 hypothetical protein [Enterobacter ludwigii]MCE1622163.1 hypothetical protein [Enterobacter ludwigii]